MPVYRIETPVGAATVVTKRLKSGRWGCWTEGHYVVANSEIVAFMRVFVRRLREIDAVVTLWSIYDQAP